MNYFKQKNGSINFEKVCDEWQGILVIWKYGTAVHVRSSHRGVWPRTESCGYPKLEDEQKAKKAWSEKWGESQSG